MGLFNKLFAKETKPTIEYEENWASYFTLIKENNASIFLDLGLAKVAPINNKDNLLWITIPMNNPREDGLSSSEESKILWEIEDNIIETLSKTIDALFVGKVTSNKEIVLFLYTDKTEIDDKTIFTIMKNYPNYTYKFKLNKEPKWEAYFNFLHPTPKEYQQLMNSKVLFNLESHGDKLTKARLVYHWIYFKKEEDKKVFLEKIKDLNFKIEEESFNKNKDQTYKLVISRIDKVDYKNLNSYTLMLWDYANETNGDYSGWETSVEK